MALAAVILAACVPSTPESAATVSRAIAAETADASPAPTRPTSPSPSYRPGPHAAGGTVVRRTPIGVLIQSVDIHSVDRSEEIDLRSVIDVWRDTSVPADAIEIGDELSVNGTRSLGAFVARYVWANIGRLDGVIRSIDSVGMTVAYQRAGSAPGDARVEFSEYLEVVPPGSTSIASASRADLRVGLVVGMVLYRPREGIPRATRIWL